MRLLVVDGSNLLGWRVQRLAPVSVEIVHAGSFAEADRVLRDEPPDAAVFCLNPHHLEWRNLLDRCVNHQPVIPFLCCSALEIDEGRGNPLPCRPEDYFSKSASMEEFRHYIRRVVDEARAGNPRRFSPNEARRGGAAERTPRRAPV